MEIWQWCTSHSRFRKHEENMLKNQTRSKSLCLHLPYVYFVLKKEIWVTESSPTQRKWQSGIYGATHYTIPRDQIMAILSDSTVSKSMTSNARCFVVRSFCDLVRGNVNPRNVASKQYVANRDQYFSVSFVGLYFFNDQKNSFVKSFLLCHRKNWNGDHLVVWKRLLCEFWVEGENWSVSRKNVVFLLWWHTPFLICTSWKKEYILSYLYIFIQRTVYFLTYTQYNTLYTIHSETVYVYSWRAMYPWSHNRFPSCTSIFIMRKNILLFNNYMFREKMFRKTSKQVQN